MDIESAIEALRGLYPGIHLTRGATATEGHKNYRAASRFTFHYCGCAFASAEYGGVHEFVANGPHGDDDVVQAIGVNLRQRLITCGPHGYHETRRPVCQA